MITPIYTGFNEARADSPGKFARTVQIKAKEYQLQ